MNFTRKLITTFIDEDSEFHGYAHVISLNNGEFKDTYRSVFNTDFFPQLLDIASSLSEGSISPWSQKTIILEDDDQRLTLNFKLGCGFDSDKDLLDEDKEIYNKFPEALMLGEHVEIDVISDGDSDKKAFFYQMSLYNFCKNILHIIERDLEIYNENIGKPDGYYRKKEEKVKTISRKQFLKTYNQIMNVNLDLRGDIIDSYNDEIISKGQAEKLLKKYNFDPLK